MIKKTDLPTPTDLPDEGSQNSGDLKVDLTIQDLSSVVVLPVEQPGEERVNVVDIGRGRLHPFTYNTESYLDTIPHYDMQRIYPVYLPDGKELADKPQLIVRGLLAFFKAKHPEVEETPVILTYEKLLNDSTVKFFRFQFNDNGSHTYAMDTAHVESFTSNMCEGDYTPWADSKNSNKEMLEVTIWGRMGHPQQVYPQRVSKLPIELPIEFLRAPRIGPMDHLHSGDFIQLAEVMEVFTKEFHERLGRVTHLAQKIGYLATGKDHDLYLTFKGTDQMTKINVGLEKVYPLLPESGELELGDNPINLEDWASSGKVIQVNVKRVAHATKQINKMIEGFRGRISADPVIQQLFNEILKHQLMAASHFMKQIYAFSGVDGKALVEQVADDMIRKLTAKGGRIGLDVNSWVVWEYHDEGMPTKVEDPELDFLKTVRDRYLESFMTALYARLLDSFNPYIKPYDYRETVLEDDGITVGSMRQV